MNKWSVPIVFIIWTLHCNHFLALNTTWLLSTDRIILSHVHGKLCWYFTMFMHNRWKEWVASNFCNAYTVLVMCYMLYNVCSVLSTAIIAPTTRSTQSSRPSGPESTMTADVSRTGSSYVILSEFPRVILRSRWWYQYIPGIWCGGTLFKFMNINMPPLQEWACKFHKIESAVGEVSWIAICYTF